MIIFELILTTFEAVSFFEAAGTVAKIGSSLKPDHHRQIQIAQICKTLCSNCHGLLSWLLSRLSTIDRVVDLATLLMKKRPRECVCHALALKRHDHSYLI